MHVHVYVIHVPWNLVHVFETRSLRGLKVLLVKCKGLLVHRVIHVRSCPIHTVLY